MEPDKGLEALKRSRFLCPFAVAPQTYGLDPADMPATYLCWFKAQNYIGQRGPSAKIDPMFTGCGQTIDFPACPLYVSAAPPL